VRYYGDPVQAEASISSDSSRVSMDQFLQVMLGALCTVWGLNGSEVKEAAKLIKLAWKCFLKGLENFPESSHKAELAQSHWLKIMTDASRYLLRSRGTEQESCRRLIALDQKHSHHAPNTSKSTNAAKPKVSMTASATATTQAGKRGIWRGSLSVWRAAIKTYREECKYHYEYEVGVKKKRSTGTFFKG
jgi:hypothetical protein